MKKIALIILTLVMSLNVSFTASSKEIDIPDPNFEATIREALNKPEGPINAEDFVILTELNAREQEITDITGIEHCVNLQQLDLSNNRISDLTPLSKLSNLQTLILGNNQIVDISPLQKSIDLEQLELNSNKIVDISPLNRLTNLKLLYLNHNQIDNISDLTNLIDLRILHLNNNNIRDISPLSNLAKIGEWDVVWMIHLGLANNQISDINPIMNNPGIDEGDVVDLRDNPLDNPENIKDTAVSKGFELLVTSDSEIFLALEGSTSLGDIFIIKINADNFSDLAGFQFNLEFNSELLEPQEISEGPFLKQGGNTFWFKPKIEENVIRDISTNLFKGGVNGGGLLVELSFKVVDYGTSIIKLKNIKLMNSQAEHIYISEPESLEIIIPTPYDLNKDGKINIFDLVLVGNHFGESGPEGDINNDGKVDIFDLVLVGNHLGEVLATPYLENRKR